MVVKAVNAGGDGLQVFGGRNPRERERDKGI